ncbi:hypothetical protein D3C80_1893530 [compost metagenome]
MKVPSDLQVPAMVKDSLDEALLVAESLPSQAAAALQAAGRFAFDHSFFMIITGLAVFLAAASLIVRLTGARSQKREAAES